VNEAKALVLFTMSASVSAAPAGRAVNVQR
jgi:hypothetical protein